MARLKIDTREDKSFVRKVQKVIPSEVVTLDAGDYWVLTDDKPIVIERSTYSDFVGKIMSGRLFKQVAKCQSVTDKVIFCIELSRNIYGNESYCGFPRKSFIGMLGRLVMDNVYPICVVSSSDTVNLLSYLYHKVGGEKKEYNPFLKRTKFQGLHTADMQTYLLSSFQGIGQMKAEKALCKFPLKKLLNMSEPEMIEVFGKPGAKMYEVINHV